MAKKVEFGSDMRYGGVLFGRGTETSPETAVVIRPLRYDWRGGFPALIDLSHGWKSKATVLGWSEGCPIPNRLIKERGAQNIAQRYADLNFFWNYLVEEARRQSGSWLEPWWLQKPMDANPRLPGELPLEGTYDPRSVPELYKTHLAPRNTFAGYVIPRIAADIATLHAPDFRTNPNSRALEILRDSIQYAKGDSVRLAAVVADYARDELGVHKVYSRLGDRRYLLESQCYSAFMRLHEVLAEPDFIDMRTEYGALSNQLEKVNPLVELDDPRRTDLSDLI